MLEKIIKANADIFALDYFELGSTDIVTHDIVTGDHPPAHQPPRRIPFSPRPKVPELHSARYAESACDCTFQ